MPDQRTQQIERLRASRLDVLILGGGINGAGLLRDLALRARQGKASLRLGLVEQGHFASGTSGKNSQLIHGGLRYLKYLQLNLVRESLRERSILRKIAPRFVQPLPFLLPMYGVQSRLIYGAGLWLYDRLAGADRIAPHRILSRHQAAALEPGLNRTGLSAAAIFWDCCVPSAQFVIENILDAVAQGALAANYVQAEAWERDGDALWRVRCRDGLSGERFELRARKLVDARGAWSDSASLRLVRGSHIVLPRVPAGDRAIAHFEPGGRVVFLIPWGSRRQLTLVGTTEVDHLEDADRVQPSPRELDYLLGIVRKLFPGNAASEPISSFSSLRPLVRGRAASVTSASREHRIWNSSDGILHIAGGKYTTYRLMSEQAGDLACRDIAPHLARLHPTAESTFPAQERNIGDAMEQHLSDYLFVSTYLGYERRWDAASLLPLAQALGAQRGWSQTRLEQEVSANISA